MKICKKAEKLLEGPTGEGLRYEGTKSDSRSRFSKDFPYNVHKNNPDHLSLVKPFLKIVS